MLRIVRENFEAICWSQGLGNPDYDVVWSTIEHQCCTRIEELLQGFDRNEIEEVFRRNGKYYYENKLPDAK